MPSEVVGVVATGVASAAAVAAAAFEVGPIAEGVVEPCPALPQAAG